MVLAGSLFQETWRTVFKLVESNFALGSTYSSFPEPIAGKELTFPLAVLDNVEPSQERLTHGLNSMQFSDMSVPVTIYTKSRAQVDQGADQIQKAFYNSQDVLLASGLHTLTVNDGGGGTDVIGDRQKIHFKTLVVGLSFIRS